MAVQPTNLDERIYAVAVILFALITFSSFVSSITNLMTNLWNLRNIETKKLVKLERYFYDKSIPFQLCVRVRRYLEHVLEEQRHSVDEKDVELLELLSTPLRMELRFEIHFKLLSAHGFFNQLSLTNLPVMHKMADGLKSILLSAGDVLFSTGDTASAMYFVEKGELFYLKDNNKENLQRVNAGEWFGGAALWTPWQHVGEMRAKTEAKLLTIDITELHDNLTKKKYASLEPAAYAAEAVHRLNELLHTDAMKVSITDLDAQVFDVDAMVKEAWLLDDDEEEEKVSSLMSKVKKQVGFKSVGFKERTGSQVGLVSFRQSTTRQSRSDNRISKLFLGEHSDEDDDSDDEVRKRSKESRQRSKESRNRSKESAVSSRGS